MYFTFRTIRSFILLLGIFLLAQPIICADDQDHFTREEQLDTRYFVRWTVDFETKEVNFTVIAETTGFIGFGLSYTGGMRNSDIAIGGVYPNGTFYFSDRHGVGNVEPVVDAQQDWKLIEAYENETHTTLHFWRTLDTCDNEDIPIGEDTLKLIWSLGETDDMSYHGNGNRGSAHINFLDPPTPAFDNSKFKTWAAAQPLILPGDDTTYWCTFFKSPVTSKKHHIVGFDIYFNGSTAKQHTHHADLYRCTAPKDQNADEFFSPYLGYGYDCYFSRDYFPVEHCQLFELQWSIGGKITIFPEFLGLPIGEGSEPEYFMTEVHYDNPDMIPALEIHSGMQMFYTEELRPVDAGFMQVGVMTSKLYSLTVPPDSEEFIVSSHCPSECTSHIPFGNGINVFIYLLHSHLSGRKEKVRHFRRGLNGEEVELPWIANDEHYDFNYQNNRHLRQEVQILPGDHLTLECTYETKWKLHGNVTLGGRSPREEMCQTFLMYYPRFLEVNQCGSYFPQIEMLDYMGIQNVTSEQGIIDPTVVMPPHLAGLKYSQVVEGIQWTENKRREFQSLTRFGQQQAYCLPKHAEEHDQGTYLFTQYPKDFVEYSPQPTCSEQ